MLYASTSFYMVNCNTLSVEKAQSIWCIGYGSGIGISWFDSRKNYKIIFFSKACRPALELYSDSY